MKAENTTDNLCGVCSNKYPECNSPHMLFGNGIGSVNVTECSHFQRTLPHPMLTDGFFNYQHLPEHLASISKPFCDLAVSMDLRLSAGSEKESFFRKLLEAKACAVRAAL